MEFNVTDSTTLEDLLALQLHLLEDDVRNIVDKAVKEMAIEKVLLQFVQWIIMYRNIFLVRLKDNSYLVNCGKIWIQEICATSLQTLLHTAVCFKTYSFNCRTVSIQ